MSKHARSRAQQLSVLLEEFVRERRYVPERAQVIESLDELPLRLQARANGAQADAQWRAWVDGHRTWFVVGQRVRVPGEQVREITLRIAFYDHDGVQAACGIWLRRDTGHWVLYSVLDEQQAIACERAAAYEQLALAS
jgi:hypothetical protein